MLISEGAVESHNAKIVDGGERAPGRSLNLCEFYLTVEFQNCKFPKSMLQPKLFTA